MPSRIHQLPDELISRIAGRREVVERPLPSSRNWWKNSLDAGATSLSVHIEGAGRVGDRRFRQRLRA